MPPLLQVREFLGRNGATLAAVELGGGGKSKKQTQLRIIQQMGYLLDNREPAGPSCFQIVLEYYFFMQLYVGIKHS